MSPGEQQAAAAREREREQRSQRPGSPEAKKMKRDTEVSDGEKSDQDLVVDDPNDGSGSGAGVATNGNHHSPRENGIDGKKSPRSPGSESSSSGKKKEDVGGKKSSLRSTPTSKQLGTVPQIPGGILLNYFSFFRDNFRQNKSKSQFRTDILFYFI